MNNRELILGDSFDYYSKDFNIAPSHVRAAFSTPSNYQKLPNGLELFFKQFESDNVRNRNLLLGAQYRETEVIFSFCYWLPESLHLKGIELEDVLKIFVNSFGLKVRIGNQEYYFAKDLRTSFHSRLEHPEQVISTVGDQNIPCHLHAILREESVGAINWVYIHYCFAINKNRYLVWLNNVETELFQVPISRYDYFKSLVDTLRPDGKTKLKILKSKHPKGEQLVINSNNEKYVEIEIPKFANKSFSYILKSVNELSPTERILVVPDYKDPVRCLFCGSFNISSEHIFPKWMRDYFADKDLGMGVAVAFKGEWLLDAMNSFVAHNKENLYGFTIDNICVSCNTGWMSTLESKVKEVFVNAPDELVDSIAKLGLTNQRRAILAQWLLLKALCMIRKGKLPMEIPETAYGDLKKGIITDGFIFEVFTHDVYGFNFILTKGVIDQRLIKVSRLDITIADKLSKKLFCMTLHIGRFFFRVSFFNEETGLIRRTCIRKTEVIYPIDKRLDHHTIKNEDDLWDKTVEENKIVIFNAGIYLTDKKEDEDM